MRVLKWSVPVDSEPHQIGSGPVMLVACQRHFTLAHQVAGEPPTVEVWTFENDIDVDLGTRGRWVRVFGTGESLPEGTGAGYHLGSALMNGGALVWHVFEVRQQ